MRPNRIALVVIAVACALLLPSAWLAVRSWGQNPATPGDSTKHGPGDVTSLISSADAPTTIDAAADSTKRGTDVEPSQTAAADEPVLQGPNEGDVQRPVVLSKDCQAQCIGDDGKPIEGVIVDVFREAPKQESPTPRVEVYGQTRSDGDGRIKLGLPVYVARSASGDEKRPVRFILYFTSPGLPVKSLVLDDVQLIPEKIVLPAKSIDKVYVPRNHLVEGTDKGIVMAVRVTGTPGFTDRRDSEAAVSGSGVFGGGYGPAPVAEPAAKGEIVVYHLQNASSESVAKVLTDLYADQSNIAVDVRTNALIVRAPADLQNTIEALIQELDRGEEATPSGGGGGGFHFGPSGGFGGPSGEGGASRTNDSGGRDAQSTVVYPIDDADADVDAIVASLVNQYGGRADIRRHEKLKAVVVSAPPEMQREIRGMIMMQVAQRSRSTRRNRDDSSTGDYGGTQLVVSYPIHGGSAEEWAKLLANSLRGTAEIRADERTNSLVITASPETQAEARLAIQLLEQLAPRNTAESAGPPRPYRNMGAAQQAASKSMDAAVENLRNAKTKDEKQAAKDALRQTLVEVFTADMQAREKAVNEIESRIGQLRKQYQAREKVKDEIIDLQLKVLENEAAGLGFPAASTSGGQPRTTPRGGGSYDPPTSGSGFRNQPGTGTTLPQTGGRPDVPITHVIGQQLQNVYRHSGIEATGTSQELADTLQKEGHLVVSPDHKLYAYVYDDPAKPSGPAQIRLCAVVTGEVIVSAEVDHPVGKLEYSEKGIFTREANGLLNFRLPLQLSSVGAGPFHQTTSDGGTDARSVETRLRRLLKKGHFVVSPDAKWYAYVETIPPTGSPEFLTPESTDIRVCDVPTGKLVALYRANSPVGELRFTSLDAENFGVEAREADGTWKLCIQLSKRAGPEGPVYEPPTIPEPKSGGADAGGGLAPQTTALPSSALGRTPSAASSANVLGDYKLLHSEYVTAREELRQVEAMVRTLVADAQKQNPQATEDDVKKQHPRQWQLAAVARTRWQQTQRMYRAKLELLEFDLIAAENALHAAQSQLSRIQSLYETGDAPVTEFERQRAVLQNAELDLQRAKTVYGLFQSIADEADAAEPTDATDETDAPDTPEDAGTSDATDASDPAAASP